MCTSSDDGLHVTKTSIQIDYSTTGPRLNRLNVHSKNKLRRPERSFSRLYIVLSLIYSLLLVVYSFVFQETMHKLLTIHTKQTFV